MTAKSLIQFIQRAFFAATACVLIVGRPDTARADLESTIQFDIAAQKLPSALLKYSEQSGVQVASLGELIEGKTSAGVVGSYAAREALEQLLKGTELVIDVIDGNSVAIRGNAAMRSQKEVPADGAAEGKDLPLRQASGGTATSASDTADSSVPAGEESKASEKDEPERLTEVLVTAQKREERLQDVPISISVLGGDDLDKSSLVSVTDALSTIPGVVVQTSNMTTATSIAIRGVASSGSVLTGASPIAYYLDTVPFGLVKTSIAPDTNAYDLERLEVLKGPQGTLYGASAQNGVVRVLTREANLNDFEFKARAGVSNTDGSGANYRGDFAVNVPIIEGKLAARAVIGYQDYSGWIDNRVERGINDSRIQNYRLKLNAQPTNQLSLGLSIWSSRSDLGAPSTSQDGAFFDGFVPQPIDTDYDTYGFKFAYEFERFSVSSATSYIDYSSDGRFDTTPISPDPLNAPPNGLYGTYLATNFASTVFSEEILFSSKNVGPWRWSAGAIYRDATEGFLQNFPGIYAIPAGSRYAVDWRYGSESYAIYGEFSRRFFADKLEGTLGLRHFHDEVTARGNLVSTSTIVGTESSYNSTTPRAVLTWYPNENLTLYGSYSEGFRSGFTQDPSVISGYPDVPSVKPDLLHNYEIGVKADVLDRRLAFEGAVYYIKWNDVQQTGSITGTFLIAALNGVSASGVGVDFGAVTRLTDRLTVTASGSWNDLAQDKDTFSGQYVALRKGARLNFSSEYTVGASADYAIPLGGGGSDGVFSVSSTYASAQTVTSIFSGAPSTIVQGDPVWIARAAFTLNSRKPWTAMVYADNVSNENNGYVAGGGFPSYTPRIRPRTVGVQLDYRFD